MLTPARAAISRVEAPWNPFAANTSSAAARMRAFVDPGASRAFSSADLTTRTAIQSIDRVRVPRRLRGVNQESRRRARRECRRARRRSLLELRGAVQADRTWAGEA